MDMDQEMFNPMHDETTGRGGLDSAPTVDTAQDNGEDNHSVATSPPKRPQPTREVLASDEDDDDDDDEDVYVPGDQDEDGEDEDGEEDKDGGSESDSSIDIHTPLT